LFGACWCATQQYQNDKAKQWEYETMMLPCNSDDTVKRLAKDGWMLVSVEHSVIDEEPRIAQAPVGQVCTYTFKRLKL